MQFKRTFRWRIFITLFAMVSFVILLLAAVIYQWLQSQALKDVEKAQMNAVESIDGTLSAQIDAFRRNAMEIYSDSSSLVLLSHPDYHWYQYASQYASRSLSLIKNSPFIDFVTLFDGEGIILTTQLTDALSEESFDRLHETVYGGSDDILFFPATDMQKGKSVPILCVVFGERDFTAGGWRNGVMLGINLRRLSQVVIGELDEIYVTDPGGKILMASQMEQFGLSLLELGVLREPDQLSGMAVTDTYRLGQDQYMLCAIRSEQQSYMVVSAQKRGGMLPSLQKGMGQLIGIFLLIALLAFLCSYFLSTKISKPVSDLVRDITQLHGSGEKNMPYPNDMAFAKASLLRTAHKIEQLQKTHSRDLQVRYLLGMSDSFEKPSFEESEMGLVAVVDVVSFGETEIPADITIVSETILSVLKEAMHWKDCTVLTMRNDRLVVIFGGQYDNEVETVLLKLKTAVFDLLKAVLCIAACGTAEGTTLKTRYDIACERMQSAALYGYDAILIRPQEKTAHRHLPKELLAQTAEAIRGYSEANMRLLTQRLINEAARLPYKAAILQLGDLCRRASAEVLGSAGHEAMARQSDIHSALVSSKTPDELQQALLSFFFGCFTAIRSAKQVGSSDMLLHALSYIKENYRNPELSMQKAAAYVNISPSHFSRSFSDYVGMKFPAYVNSLRLEKGYTMLQEDTLTISEIAKSVGFFSGSYFASAFHKKYGIPPSQARKYHILQQEPGKDR